MRIILASSSPRRRELLAQAGIDFEIMPPDVDEAAFVTDGIAPDALVAELSKQKARRIAADIDGAAVIGADTIVYLGGEILGKPQSASDAVGMLRKISGKTHTVYTGVTVITPQDDITFVSRTDVKIRELSDGLIRAYVKSGEPLDKAGSYAAQGLGARFIESISGDFYTVVGLPVCGLVGALEDLGVIRGDTYDGQAGQLRHNIR